MKPISIINQGEDFLTLRVTTDRPREIRDALETREVQHILKGDQNQAWDAVIANHCLNRALEDSGAALTFFVQDERLGTPDQRLERLRRAAGDPARFRLTEDYYRGRGGAVWEHQDVSFGLFFTEAVSPEQFRRAGLDLRVAAEQWSRLHAEASADGEWIEALAALGVRLPADGNRQDDATRLGPAPAAAGMADLAAADPGGALYYALTKTDGLYGIVPTGDANEIMSSVSAADPELRAVAARLLRIAAAGALRQASSPGHRRAVTERARLLAAWGAAFLDEHPHASVADVQVALGRRLTEQIFPPPRFDLDRASRLARIPVRPQDGRPTGSSFHFFVHLALAHPAEFAEAYNEALNRLGLGLQRVRYEPGTGRYTPPFFVEFAPEGAGTPVYRFSVELAGLDAGVLRLSNPSAGEIAIPLEQPIRSGAALMHVLRTALGEGTDITLIGKAALLAAELQLSPRGLGLPRQGSKYAPMVDHLLAGLRRRGVLRHPAGLLIRIGLNALDRLEAMGDVLLRLPRFLEDVMGPRVTCRSFAERWRAVAGDAAETLTLLRRVHPGQHVHLARLLAANRLAQRRGRREGGDPRLRRLLSQLLPEGEAQERLGRLGADLPEASARELQRLCDRREELLARRRAAAAAARRAHTRGRLRPAFDPRDERERRVVELQLFLLVAAYVRRLWQRAESLPYLNDRPYTLGLFLLFGREIFAPICRQVEFDVEYLTPDVGAQLAGPTLEPALCPQRGGAG